MLVNQTYSKNLLKKLVHNNDEFKKIKNHIHFLYEAIDMKVIRFECN